jgi:hypothetical protein
VQVDAAGTWVLCGVTSHEVASCVVNLFPHDEQTTVVCEGGGLNKYQATGADDPPDRFFVACSCLVAGGPPLTGGVRSLPITEYAMKAVNI